MKSFLPVPLFIIIAAGFAGSSCNKLSLEITPRKYRAGFHVSLNVDRHQGRQSAETNYRKGKMGDHTSALVVTGGPVKAPEIIQASPVEKDFKTPQNFSTKRGKAPCASPVEKPSAPVSTVDRSTNAPGRPAGNSRMLYWMGGIAALFSSALLLLSRRRGAKISRWSARNPFLSRCIQFAGHISLGLAGFMAGSVLYKHGVVAVPGTETLFTSIFLGAAALYPLKKGSRIILPSGYTKSKLADVTLIMSSLLMSTTFGNQVSQQRLIASKDNVVAYEPARQFFERLSAVADHVDEDYFSTVQPDAKGNKKAARVALIVAVIISFVLTVVFLAFLACYLVCTGNLALAILTLTGGLGLFIYLFVYSIREIGKIGISDSPATPPKAKIR
jgi:hypothetical protein